MERRCEKRLRYNWPVWFAEDFSGILCQGQMVDINSDGAAFNCYENQNSKIGQYLTARFSVPRYGTDDSFEMENYVREGSVCRIDKVSDFVQRIAVRFVSPLPFKPGEQNSFSNSQNMAAASAN